MRTTRSWPPAESPYSASTPNARWSSSTSGARDRLHGSGTIVVASHDAAGYIAPDDGRADIYVPLDALTIDETRLRTESGFDSQPDADDIAGTRSNMLQKVLDADRYPFALIKVNELDRGRSGPVRVVVTLHGITNPVDAAAQWDATAEEFAVTGTFAIDQSGFGLTPFSVLGGALAVADRVNVSFRIRARRIDPARDAL